MNNKRATAFRRWEVNVLRAYVIRGNVLDNECMKNGTFEKSKPEICAK